MTFLRRTRRASLALSALHALLLAGCTVHGSSVEGTGEPPAVVVEHERDNALVRVAHPDRFALATATAIAAASEISVTGVISPDVSRNAPVVSLAAGRAIDLRVRLGDQVRKGQLLLRIESQDVSAAFADYSKALADFTLADGRLTRSTGGSFDLVNITRAALTGGPSDNRFDVSGWLGLATLTGGGGNDTYVFNRGDGQDQIVNGATSQAPRGELDFGAGINDQQLWFQQNANDLTIEVMGSDGVAGDAISFWQNH